MVKAQLPLAPRNDGKGLPFLGLAAEHVSHRLTTRPASWQSGLSIDFSEKLPVTVSHPPENDVPTGVRTHMSIVVQPCSDDCGDSRLSGGHGTPGVTRWGVIPGSWPTAVFRSICAHGGRSAHRRLSLRGRPLQRSR